jgi:DNA polymerase/3'-5' exonuclease PolX
MASSEKQIPYEEAKLIAEKYLQIFKPLCERIEIAGSIRREKKLINDIELVCIPSTIRVEDGLFEFKNVRAPEFVSLVDSFNRVKGNGAGKYAQLNLPEGILLDLFITTREQWGVIFMIRTGSAMFSHRMVIECKDNGYYVKDGYLWRKKDNAMIACPEEEDFFRITKLPYIKPYARAF